MNVHHDSRRREVVAGVAPTARRQRNWLPRSRKIMYAFGYREQQFIKKGEDEKEMSDQSVAVFEIKNYMVIWRQLEEREFAGVSARIRGLVRCTGHGTGDKDEYRLDVYFLSPDSAVPDPQVDIANRRGAIFMMISDIHAFVDILRNEAPIFGHLRGDYPQWTSVTTTNEPVGTGDEDHRIGR